MATWRAPHNRKPRAARPGAGRLQGPHRRRGRCQVLGSHSQAEALAWGACRRPRDNAPPPAHPNGISGCKHLHVLSARAQRSSCRSRAQPLEFDGLLSPPHLGSCFPAERKGPSAPLPPKFAASVSPGNGSGGLGASGPRGFLPFSGSCEDVPAAEAERGSEAAGVEAPIGGGDAGPRT